MAKINWRVTGTFLCALALGCTALPGPHTYVEGQRYINPAYVPDPYESRTAETQGRDFCNDLAKTSRDNAVQHRRSGWILGGFSLGVAGAGVAVGATDQSDDQSRKDAYKAVVVAAPLAAGLLAYLAAGQFSMADNSQSLASATTTAHNLKDIEANAACNGSLAAWEDGSKGASKAFIEALEQVKEGNKKRADEEKADEEKADEEKADEEKADEEKGNKEKAKPAEGG